MSNNPENDDRRYSEPAAPLEERYRALLNAIDEGFCVFEMIFDDRGRPVDYRFLETNPAFELQTGLRDAQGKTIREMVPDHEAHWFETYGRVATTGEPVRFENRGDYLPRRGWFDVYAFRIGRPEDRLVAALFNNVTARKETEEALRQSEQRYREIVEQVEDYAIFRIDLNGCATTWNEGVRRVLGFEEHEFVGCDVTETIFTPEDIAAGVPQMELDTAAREGSAGNDRWMRRKSGERFFALGVTNAITDPSGRVTGFTKVMRDHTAIKVAEQARAESEERFRTLADSMPQLVWVAEPNGKVTYYNARVKQFDGLLVDEQTGRWQWEPAVHPDDLERTLTAWEESTRTGKEYRVEHRIKMRTEKGFRYRWMLSRAVPVRDPSGTVNRWYGTATDIHAIKKAEQAVRKSEERFRNMADTAPATLWVSDTENQTTFLSRGWYELTGQSQDDGLGFGWTQCLHREDRDQTVNTFLEAAERREEFSVDYRLRRADGQYRWAVDSGRPRFTSEGEFAGYIGAIIDVHERKRAEEAVQRSHDELELRIAERTRELRNRAEQLSRLASELSLTEQRERQRLAQILHDHLQQLLVGANLRLNLIARGASSTQNNAISSVRDLIGEAIDASRSLTVELSPPILHEAGLTAGLEWLSRWMRDKHGLQVDLELEGRPVAQREDVRVFLFQAVRELLFNAVKHARTGRAAVRVAVPEPGYLRIDVSDEGPGFDPEAVFGPNAPEEVGFGLFTIRERLTLLGGRLVIESAVGQGARFTLLAPNQAQVPSIELESAPETGRKRTRTHHAGRHAVRVLLVDDHKVMREGLDSLLSGEPGMQVVGEAADGLHAVEQALALQPDIVLMDFSLPKIDGVEATKRIKAELPHVKVIGLSMYEEPDRAAAMIDAGASAYLTKSGNSDNLLDTIQSVYDSSTRSR